MTTLTAAAVSKENLPGWGIFDDDGLQLRTRADTRSFARGLELVNRIGELAEAANHHPDIQLTYPAVGVTLTTHDAGGLTNADIELAKQISSVAAVLDVDLSPPER